ncbi:MAG TPA: hypothetical protein VHK27_06145, partial [Gammaproteobacteria bacterium]|nr:hypothetical protein [Gammaproteobacteria bacterium]
FELINNMAQTIMLVAATAIFIAELCPPGDHGLRNILISHCAIAHISAAIVMILIMIWKGISGL